ncbi:MAG: low molecular weight protein-tyrosine-phosphatase [Planctomycetota bacterium]
MIRVLFVCMGNICRSPTAEGVLRQQLAAAGIADQVEVASAGTIDSHAGDRADRRATRAARARGIDLAGHRARGVTVEDFERFDLVLALDRENFRDLERICPPGREARLHLFMRYAPQCETEDVPDPYYGDAQAFETVLDLVEAAARGLVVDLQRRLRDQANRPGRAGQPGQPGQPDRPGRADHDRRG